jgi:Na+-transporting NADH:ubiquinone oxidoreductase subunit B
VAVGISFGVVIGKEVFGGTGMNVFNPALVARAFVFFAYPAQISGDKVWTVVGDKTVDAYSGATPLLVASSHHADNVVTGILEFGKGIPGYADIYSFTNMFVGLIPGSIGETSAIANLIGAAILIITGIGSWVIMFSVCLGALLMVLVMNGLAPNDASFLALPVHFHFVTGGFLFGTIYMATDPVTAAATNIGKWIYGFLIGVIVIIIRTANPAYPEGMMLAILFMNAFAPLIDYVVIQKHISWRLQRAQA